jgi:CMP-N-acetylneuraminic acid synthetase
MAGDEAPVGDAILHLLDHLEQPYDYFILLQPTSPFRSTDDINGCIEKCVTRQAPACVGMVEPEKSPYWSFIADDEDRLTRLVEPGGPTHRRQGLPQVYASNGALFAASIPFFREAKRFFVPGTLGYVMPRERSIDIDDRLDFMFAELLIDQMGLGARD